MDKTLARAQRLAAATPADWKTVLSPLVDRLDIDGLRDRVAPGIVFDRPALKDLIESMVMRLDAIAQGASPIALAPDVTWPAGFTDDQKRAEIHTQTRVALETILQAALYQDDRPYLLTPAEMILDETWKTPAAHYAAATALLWLGRESVDGGTKANAVINLPKIFAFNSWFALDDPKADMNLYARSMLLSAQSVAGIVGGWISDAPTNSTLYALSIKHPSVFNPLCTFADRQTLPLPSRDMLALKRLVRTTEEHLRLAHERLLKAYIDATLTDPAAHKNFNDCHKAVTSPDTPLLMFGDPKHDFNSYLGVVRAFRPEASPDKAALAEYKALQEALNSAQQELPQIIMRMADPEAETPAASPP